MSRLNREADWTTADYIKLGQFMKKIANEPREEDGGDLAILQLRADFIDNPIDTLTAEGITVNAGQNIVVVEDSKTTVHIVIPETIPDDAHHTDEQTGIVTVAGCR